MIKNRFAIIVMTFLMITWFTPFILRDNIASGAIVTPVMTTETPTGVGTTNGTLHGTIVSKGNSSISSYGFQWGLTTSYTEGYISSSDLDSGFDLLDTDLIRVGDRGVYSDGTYTYAVNYNGVNSSIYAYYFDGSSFTLLDYIYDTGVNQNYREIFGDGTYLYVTANDGGLNAYSFNGTALTKLNNIDNGSGYYDVWCNDTYIFTTCSGEGIRAYSFNGTNFTLLDTQDDGGTYFGVYGNDSYIFVACFASGIRAYTFDGSNFALIDTQADSNTMLEVWTDDTYIYAVNASDVFAYSFAGASFSLEDSIEGNGGYPYGIYGDANYIYTCEYSAGVGVHPDVVAYDFNGTTLTELAVYNDTDYYCWDLWCDNSTIYVGSYTGGIHAYSFGVGSFSFNLIGLTPGTVYHYRSYANNSLFTGYGNDMTLYTNSIGGIWLDFIINVRNESNGSQGIPFSIMIKNLNGTQVYSLLGQHTSCHLNTSALTGNQQVLIKVWSLGYRERIITIPLYDDNVTANYTFYLPREEMEAGLDPGGGSGYYANSSIIPYIYNIRVVETIRTDYSEFDRPIAGAWVNVRRFINSTGAFELMSTLVTDTNGWCNLYLIPSVLYIFDLSAEDYDNATSDWNPVPPNPYQMTETKIFRMTRTIDIITPANYTWVLRNITFSVLPLELKHQGSITFWYNITSYDNQLQWYRMTVEFYNKSNNTWYVINAQNETNAHGGSINYTTPNVTGSYRLEVYFKKYGFSEYQIYQTGSLHYTIIYIQEWIDDIPDFVWYLIIIVLMIMFMGFCFTVLNTGLLTGYLGLGVFAFGIFMKPDLVINNFPAWQIWALTFLLYTMGIFLWSKL